jgi:integrase
MLCLRLGARPGDLVRARWRDIDWKRKVMAMPDTKGKPYEIPLTLQSLKELRKLGNIPAPNKDLTVDFIFPSPRIGKNDGHMVNWLEPKAVLSHSGNCGRHTHHTIGAGLEINELILDVLEGRSIMKAGLPGRNYVDQGELGRNIRMAQQRINREIDRMFRG